ncbi:unnamed protein product [Vitrella brassicaformis CCMP3155]|uniref:Uncharacterized protein n=1 Tax=Vitrella brassicaformis (strain CCMP3155) TaxID=1169540 RepID=A0A0G4EEN2_VITBC|nr:unnamed protein product [Vitrella brassicaformis CCMP3155]|eukprot:CEL93856.1 unnamed protein product [Vitrella brassicaformis CCMP3155]
MAVIHLSAFLPAAGICNKVVRSIKEGLPTCNPLLMTLPAIAYILFPRMLQAEAPTLSSKLAYSILISIFDMIFDILLPTHIALFLSIQRLLKARFNNTLFKNNNPIAAKKEPAKSHEGLQRQQQKSYSFAALAYIRTHPRLGKNVVSLQAALALLEITPRYLRSLCEQISLWSLAEMTSLLYINLAILIASAVHGASPLTLGHQITGLALIIAMECACEGMVLVAMVRLLTCLLAATTCVLVWLPFMPMHMTWRDADATVFCPTFSDTVLAGGAVGNNGGAAGGGRGRGGGGGRGKAAAKGRGGRGRGRGGRGRGRGRGGAAGGGVYRRRDDRYLVCTNYSNNCPTVLQLPSRGQLTAHNQRCPICHFQALSVRNEETGRSHHICPHCFRNPPMDYATADFGNVSGDFRCFKCTHPKCSLSTAGRGFRGGFNNNQPQPAGGGGGRGAPPPPPQQEGKKDMEVSISGFRAPPDSLESRHLLQKILRCLEDARDQSRVNDLLGEIAVSASVPPIVRLILTQVNQRGMYWELRERRVGLSLVRALLSNPHLTHQHKERHIDAYMLPLIQWTLAYGYGTMEDFHPSELSVRRIAARHLADIVCSFPPSVRGPAALHLGNLYERVLRTPTVDQGRKLASRAASSSSGSAAKPESMRVSYASKVGALYGLRELGFDALSTALLPIGYYIVRSLVLDECRPPRNGHARDLRQQQENYAIALMECVSSLLRTAEPDTTQLLQRPGFLSLYYLLRDIFGEASLLHFPPPPTAATEDSQDIWSPPPIPSLPQRRLLDAAESGEGGMHDGAADAFVDGVRRCVAVAESSGASGRQREGEVINRLV